MKKFILILVIIVALIIAGVSFLFYQTIDGESYKAQVIASTRELLGREVLVKGPVTVELFPSPVITLTDVEVRNRTGFHSNKLISIKKIEAHIQFSSLFQNPLIVENIILSQPQIYLEKNKNGLINWDLAFLKPAKRLISKDDLLGQSFADLPPQFQNMQIEGGSITYKNLITNTSLTLGEINGKIKTQSIKGPFDFNGSLKMDKTPVDITLHVDKIGADIETKFDMMVSGVNSKAVFSVQNGKIVRLAEAAQEIYGPFTFNIPKLSDFLVEAKGIKRLPAELNKKIIGNGQFRLSAQSMKFEEMAARYGDAEVDSAVSGNISFIYPLSENDTLKTSAILHFSQLNLDNLLPYLNVSAKDWEKPLLSLPNILPNNLDFVADAERIIFSKQAMTNVSLRSAYDNKILEILSFNATLPEKTSLDISGSLDSNATAPFINLSVALKAKDLQPTLVWSDVKLPFIKNLAALHDVEASAEIRVRPKDLTIDKIQLAVGDGQMTGNMAFSLTEPVLTGIAQVQLASINFDNFIPYTAPTQERTVEEWLSDVKMNLENSKLLGPASLSLNITGNEITFKNLPIQKFTYDGKIEQSKWETTQLRIDQIATTNLTYSGIVNKNNNGSLSFKDVTFNVEMPKSMLLLDRMKIKSPFASAVGKVTTKGSINGSFDKLNIASETSFSQGRINFNGTIDGILTDTPKYELKTKITYPSFHQFVRLFKPTYKGLPNLTGSFSFDGLFKGTPNAFELKDVATSVGAQAANINLNFKKTDENLSVNGSVSSPLLYLDKFVANKRAFSRLNTKAGQSQFSKELLDFSELDNLTLDVLLNAQKMSFENLEITDFSTHVLLDQKILNLEKGKGSIGNGKVEFSSLLNCSMATPFLKGHLNMQNIPVRADLLSLGMFRLKDGNLFFTSNFSAKGNSIDDMINSLSATGSLNIQKGTISGLNIETFEHRLKSMIARGESFENATGALNKELTVGETAFDSLSGTYAITNGLLRSSDTVFKSKAANAIIQTDFDLSNWKLSSSAALTLTDLTGYPSISLVIKGSAHNPQTNIDLASFIKYIESSAADNRNQLLRKQRENEDIRRRAEAKGRIKKIQLLAFNAEKMIKRSEEVLKLAPSQTAQTEFIRAKDAFALLQELTQKSVPSEADVEKASVQASLITTRTQTILTDVTETARTKIKEKVAQNLNDAQEKMHAIHRIQVRLAGVDQIEQAYQKAFSAMTTIQQINKLVEHSNDFEKLQDAEKQSSEALDIMDLTYQSIAKFDIDAQTPYEEEDQSSKTMQGSIRRTFE